MSIAITKSRAMLGMQAPDVTVEVHLSFGLPKFIIVGLPEAAVKESKDRVRSAIINSNFEFPAREIIVNLAPGDLPKHGSRFDLAIAIGILAASGQVPQDVLEQLELAGELALTGLLRPVKGIFPFAIESKKQNNTIVLPKESLQEVSIINDLKLCAANSLLEVCAWLSQRENAVITKTDPEIQPVNYQVDFCDVKGQEYAKKALEIAAAGGHNMLMIGSPGAGKTMLASRVMTIMPDLSYEKALEVAAIYSLADVKQQHMMQRPFRMPHHTASYVALVGGGRPPKPGEISLAHHGILFLDELPEYTRHALETLRQPLESKMVNISRAGWQASFPASFQLIAAMNPCPCGYHGDKQKSCSCAPDQIKRYRTKISGPLLDRIDIHIEISSIAQEEWFQDQQGENSNDIKTRVVAANQRQLSRQGKANFELSTTDIKKHCVLNSDAEAMLLKAGSQYQLSMRAIHRILKVTRTIADLAASEKIKNHHLAQALSLRQIDI